MKSGADQELFTCNGCRESINNQHARILCNVCNNFNLCSNCYVINCFSKSHRKTHETTIFKISGYIGKENSSLILSNSGNFESTSKILPVESSRKHSEIPTANWGALWNVMKGPLTTRSPQAKSLKASKNSQKTVTSDSNEELSPLSGTDNPVPLSPSVRKPEQDSGFPRPKYYRPLKWEPLFGDDGSPSSIFVALMSSIFNKLDENETGYLNPEDYSNYLDIQGYPLSSNIWKMACTRASGTSSKQVADLELGLYFSQMSISHVLTARSTEVESTKGKYTKTSRSCDKKRNSVVLNENMPLLSRQGFIDICAHDYLKDPSMAYQYLMNALQELKVWKELGDIPRSILPKSPTLRYLENEEERQPIPSLELESEDEPKKIFSEAAQTSLKDAEPKTVSKNEAKSLVEVDDEESSILITELESEEKSKKIFSKAADSSVRDSEPKTVREEEIESMNGSKDEGLSILITDLESEEKPKKIFSKAAETSVKVLEPKTVRDEEIKPRIDFDEESGLELEITEVLKPKPKLRIEPRKESLSIIGDQLLTVSQGNLTNFEAPEKLSSASRTWSQSESDSLSPKFVFKLQRSPSPRMNIQMRRSNSKTPSPRLFNHKDLVVNTDFSGVWLSTASALSARSPQRKKVETLVEAYEHVRSKSICLDRIPTLSEIGF